MCSECGPHVQAGIGYWILRVVYWVLNIVYTQRRPLTVSWSALDLLFFLVLSPVSRRKKSESEGGNGEFKAR